MRPKSTVLTEQELEIMKVVWRSESVTVRDVYEDLLERRKIAYTTVMTMMRILEEKGYLSRDADAKASVYKPTKPKEKVVGGMVSDFLNRVFEGSAKPLLLHLVDNREISAKEVDDIAKLLKSRKGGK